MLKKSSILFTFILVMYTIEVQCTQKCDKLGVLLYEEIGCKPIKDQPGDECPSRYDCQHYEEPGQHCLFQGKKYKDRDALPDKVLQESCRGGCYCNAAPSGSSFTCAAYDCAEFLGGSPLQNKDCVRTYELGGCCSSGQICPPFNNVSTCKVDGVTYKQGQQISPKSTCSSCICQKGFNDKLEAPFCKRQSCAVEIRHSANIKNKCAPVYEKDSIRCCPSLWVCPSKLHYFTPSPPVINPSQKPQPQVKTCKFGDKEVKSDQQLRTNLEEYGTKYQIKCDCQLPPLLTCVIEHSEHIEIVN